MMKCISKAFGRLSKVEGLTHGADDIVQGVRTCMEVHCNTKEGEMSVQEGALKKPDHTPGTPVETF